MRKSRFSEQQIIDVVKEVEAGRKITETARKYGISEQTVHRRRAKYSGLNGSEVKRLKELEDENRRLKCIVADLTLDNTALKGLLSKEW